mmetsp:Transcript_12275/g.23791  ORF Transcript_12275/g.23791 Transcript_12275/m.23791 type:complete len:88 (+) Transcript_12275:456-719(+)
METSRFAAARVRRRSSSRVNVDASICGSPAWADGDDGDTCAGLGACVGSGFVGVDACIARCIRESYMDDHCQQHKSRNHLIYSDLLW